jgi:Arc/MetJ-type ribon-helix-helix transcriptional regulator
MGEAESWSRVTLRMPESMIDELDEFVEQGAAPNRSQIIRECVRATELEQRYR